MLVKIAKPSYSFPVYESIMQKCGQDDYPVLKKSGP